MFLQGERGEEEMFCCLSHQERIYRGDSTRVSSPGRTLFPLLFLFLFHLICPYFLPSTSSRGEGGGREAGRGGGLTNRTCVMSRDTDRGSVRCEASRIGWCSNGRCVPQHHPCLPSWGIFLAFTLRKERVCFAGENFRMLELLGS